MDEQKLLNKLDAGYSTAIMQLAKEIEQSRNLILADYSADNIGRTCGDHVQLDLVISEGRIYLGLDIQGCLHAKASGGWMLRLVNGKTIDEVFTIVTEFKQEMQKGSGRPNPWKDLTLDQNKLNCVLAPWEALSGALYRFSTATCRINPNDENALSCDACVVTSQIQWVARKGDVKTDKAQTSEKSVRRNLLPIVRDIFKRTNITKSGKFEDKSLDFQRFGKIVLNKVDKEELKHFLATLTSKDIDNLRRLRFTGILEYHSRTLGCEITNPELAFFFTRAIVKATIQEAVIKKINAIIAQENISAVFIKGTKTRELYPERFMRYSNDLDILTANFDEAIKLCSALIHHEKFYLPLKHGVAFSIKYVLDKDGSTKLIGHYHLEKYLGKHRLNIDISFPGLPLGLLNITHYPEVKDNTLSYEDQFIITLAHLFKHEVPYIKDINDLYLIVAQKKVEQDRLLQLLKHYNLSFLAYLVLSYLPEMDSEIPKTRLFTELQRNLSIVDKLFVAKIIKAGWPYKLGGHFLAQAYDIYQRRSRTHGFAQSIRDLENIMLYKKYPQDEESANQNPRNAQMNALELSLYTRLFLIPLVLFTDYFHISDNMKNSLTKLNIIPIQFESSSLILKFEKFTVLLTPAGLFLTTQDWSCEENRAIIEEKLWTVLKLIGCQEKQAIVVRTINTK